MAIELRYGMPGRGYSQEKGRVEGSGCENRARLERDQHRAQSHSPISPSNRSKRASQTSQTCDTHRLSLHSPACALLLPRSDLRHGPRPFSSAQRSTPPKQNQPGNT